MRKNYDFRGGRNNPYAKKIKKLITIRIEAETIDYFKGLSDELGIPYQTLINLYLRECALRQKKLNIKWAA